MSSVMGESSGSIPLVRSAARHKACRKGGGLRVGGTSASSAVVGAAWLGVDLLPLIPGLATAATHDEIVYR